MGELLRLLLVEDSEQDAILLAHDLKKMGFNLEMERVQTAEQLQAALAARPWDAVISDYNLPVFSAPKALEIMKQSGNDLPFIIVSGTIEEATAVEIMRSGAHDFLMKGNLNRLPEVLRREIREARGREESRRASAALGESEEQLRLLFERSNDAIFLIEKKSGRYLNANRAAEKLTGRTVAELKSLTVGDVAPRDAERHLRRISKSSETTDFENIDYLRPNGETRTAHLTVLPISDERAFGIAHDITEQLQAENRLKQHAQEMEFLYRNSLEINSQNELIPLLQTILERAAGLLKAPMGGLYLVRPERGNVLELVVGINLPEDYIGTTLQMGEGSSGLVAQTGEVMMVEDYQAWFNRAGVYSKAPFRRVLGVPMRVKGQVIGTINITDDKVTGAYTPDEIRLASLFADQAAIAVENARLLDQAQRELKERKQVEMALRESEARFRVLVTRAPLVSFVIDKNGLFTLSEGRGLETLDLKPGQVVGQSVFDLYREVPEIIEDIQSALKGLPRQRDTQVGQLFFEIHYIPVLGEDGNTSHVIGVAFDISERKNAERSLRESEESYRGLFNSVTDAVYIHDPYGHILDVNDGALTMYGYTREELIGQLPSMLGAPGRNDMEAVRQAFNKAFAGQVQQLEFVGMRKNGEIFPKEVRLFPTTYFGKQAVIALARDITERKMAEENLRATQSFLDHVLKAIPLGVSVFDYKTSLAEFSNTLNTVFNGMSMAEYNAMTSAERQSLIHPDDRDAQAAFLSNLVSLMDGETRQVEYRTFGKDGSWHWFKYLFYVFDRDENGDISRVLSVVDDVTDSKNAEKALQRQLKELTTLHNIARGGIEVNTIDELVERVTMEVGNVFYPDNFGVLLLDEAGKSLIAHPSYRGLTENVPRVVSVERSISGQVVMTGKPRRVVNVRAEAKYVEVTLDIRSELCVPIKTGNQAIGVINAESRQIGFFSDDDERMLVTIAGQLAVSIQRMRLFNSEKQRRVEAETLRQATAALSTSLDLDQVLESILTSLKQVVYYDSASVFLLEDDHLFVRIVDGNLDFSSLSGTSLPATNTLFMEIKTRGMPVILADASKDERFERWGETKRVHGWMGIPLITRGEVIGFITLDNYKPAAYTQEAGAMAQAFAHQAAAAIDNARLFKGIQVSLEELNQAYESTIEGWSRAMDLRDKETEGHTLRVTQITVRLAQSMGISGDQLMQIRRGALLHDIGKMGVPDRILLKPDNLSDDELVIMRQHPKYAYDMLSPIAYLKPALEIPYCHHERWDGKGYPRGLKGSEIPLEARLFSVIDVWDALTSDRPYRAAWSEKEAIEYIKELSGEHFDPQIVDKFIEMISSEVQ